MKRRWTIRICVLLLLGAIVNVAVAWGCMWHGYNDANQPSPVFQDVPLAQDDLDWWTRRAPAGMVKPREMTEYVNIGFVERRVGAAGPMISQTMLLYEQSVRLSAGWPALSWSGEWFSLPEPSSPTGSGMVLRGCFAAFLGAPYVPFVPVWPGFAINTLFYAAILWVLLAIPGMVRRRLRIKHRQCLACGYPMGSSEVCTECGATLKQKAESAAHDTKPCPHSGHDG